jgi:hypothetical protein
MGIRRALVRDHGPRALGSGLRHGGRFQMRRRQAARQGPGSATHAACRMSGGSRPREGRMWAEPDPSEAPAGAAALRLGSYRGNRGVAAEVTDQRGLHARSLLPLIFMDPSTSVKTEPRSERCRGVGYTSPRRDGPAHCSGPDHRGPDPSAQSTPGGHASRVAAREWSYGPFTSCERVAGRRSDRRPSSARSTGPAPRPRRAT